MKEIVLITGGHGLVAKALEKKLSSKYNIRFLTRKKVRSNDFEWNVPKGYVDKNALLNVKHVIHLAGSGIADKRWTTKRKHTLLSSRVDAAQLILDGLQKENIKIDSFISASGIGYYGATTSNTIHQEQELAANDFLGELCLKWENAAKKFKSSNIAERTIILRFGIILSSNRGALKKMMFPIKFFVGSPLGSGKQFMPWIHIKDATKMIDFFLNNKLEGTFNAVAPEQVTNKQFTEQLAEKMNKPLFSMHVPAQLLKLFFGEMAKILTEGSSVSSNKITSLGFYFDYSTLQSALANLLSKKHE